MLNYNVRHIENTASIYISAVSYLQTFLGGTEAKQTI